MLQIEDKRGRKIKGRKLDLADVIMVGVTCFILGAMIGVALDRSGPRPVEQVPVAIECPQEQREGRGIGG